MHGTGARILLIGDSHAQMMAPTFAKVAQEQNLTFATAASSGCPWQRNLFLAPTGVAGDQVFTEECIAFKTGPLRACHPRVKPDIVVAWSNDYLTRRKGQVHAADGTPVPSKGPDDLARQIKAETERSHRGARAHREQGADRRAGADRAGTAGSVPVPDEAHVARGVPVRRRHEPDAASTSCTGRSPTAGASTRRTSRRSLCPFMPICDPVLNGMIVRFDNQHITPRYAVSLAAPMTQFLQRNQLLQR